MDKLNEELRKAQGDFATQASALLMMLDEVDVSKLPLSLQVLAANAHAAMDRRDNARRAVIAQAGR